jgi:hypothetical protein
MKEVALMTKKEMLFQSKPYYSASGFNERNFFRTRIDLIYPII